MILRKPNGAVRGNFSKNKDLRVQPRAEFMSDEAVIPSTSDPLKAFADALDAAVQAASSASPGRANS
jgi:hypothetical protein